MVTNPNLFVNSNNMSFVSNIKKAYGIIKKQGPSIFSGIKKGLSISKIVLDVIKDVINRLRNVSPETAHRLERITKSPSFERLDEIVNTGNRLAQGIDNLKERGRFLSDPKNQKINRQVINDNLNDINATDIALGMTF